MGYASDGFIPGEPEKDSNLVTLRSFGSDAVTLASESLANARDQSRIQKFLNAMRVDFGHDPEPRREVGRWTCAAALILFSGPEKGGGVTNLIEAVVRSPMVRPAVANAFFVVGTNHPSIVPALKEGLADNRLTVRQFCIEAIARMSPWAHPLIPEIRKLVNDPDPIMRMYATGILTNLPTADQTEP
jgi:hypothetical protein